MKIVSLEALEENLKLFITNPETTDDKEEAARQAKQLSVEGTKISKISYQI